MLKRTTFLSLFFLALLAGCGKEEPKEAPPAPEPAMPEKMPMEAPPAPEAAMPEAAPEAAMPESAPEAAMPEKAPIEAPAAPEAAIAIPAVPVDTAQSGDMGKKVYDGLCFSCHTAAIAGAPKFGDKAAWAPRIEQGKDTLYMHAISGFTGKTGVMPPKGGNMGLSDDEVKAAVDYMVAQAQ